MTTGVESTDAGRRAVWAAGLVVATGAGVATAHGLFQVAVAARVPTGIAWLYPLITDGLALVAYAATARLHHHGRGYAATIVVLAAGLSGLAQATYLTGGLTTAGSAGTAPVVLRFGVGAWPAIAAALTAHLLHLISAGDSTPVSSSTETAVESSASNQPSNSLYNSASNPAVQLRTTSERSILPVQPRTTSERSTPAVQPPAVQPSNPPPDPVVVSPTPPPSKSNPVSGGRAADRARAAARTHQTRHGSLPTVSELAAAADVARGTAGAVLKALRAEPRVLHVVNATLPDRTTP
jgi:hypothetical protein